MALQSIRPEDEDFADLQPLKAMIGDARIVMLGEQSHGDGATFHAKVRLIKFLHEEMGFDGVVFESGFYDCHRGWEVLRTFGSRANAEDLGLLSIWSNSEQVRPLFEYMGKAANTSRPLQLFGLDIQLTGRSDRVLLIPELKQVFAELGGGLLVDEADWRAASALEGALRKHWSSVDREILRRGTHAVRTLEAKLARLPRRSQTLEFWQHALSNLYFFAHYARRGKTALAWERDRMMAENLNWIVRQDPARKLIVWAASSHVAHNAHLVEPRRRIGDEEVNRELDRRLRAGQVSVESAQDRERLQDEIRREWLQYAARPREELKSMGDYALRSFGSDVFVMGFTAHAGRVGKPGDEVHELAPSLSGSLEDLLFRAGFEYAVLDLRNPGPDGLWVQESLHARPFGYIYYVAAWGEIMDALLFVRDMYPSTQPK